MMTGTPDTVTLVPISRIEILNSRDRNMKVFEEIVDNIRAIGLKKPITVAERPGDDGDPRYVLVCGEGRLNAFRILGESHIPALVVDVTDEDAFIMSLAENISRRGYRPTRDQIKPPASSYSLVRTYQREVERQRKMVLKAEHAHQRLLLVVQGLKKLFADERFVNLLRAEGLDTLTKYLAERINTLGSTANSMTPITPEPEGATI